MKPEEMECLIPIGAFLLVKGIRFSQKSLNGRVLLEIPYLQANGQFTIVKAGYFSIWAKRKPDETNSH